MHNLKTKIGIPTLLLCERRKIILGGMLLKIRIFRDLYKRFEGDRKLKDEEKEGIVRVTHEQVNDCIQGRVFCVDDLNYLRERYVLLGSYRRSRGRGVPGELAETVAAE